MSNINKFLANILAARFGKDVRQSIHDAIKEIDSVADTAQNSATKSATLAGNHEAAAKTYMESAKASEASARASAELAMANTPEGFDELVSKVGLMDITKTTEPTLQNSKHGGLRVTKTLGNTVQNGTPSPTNPQPMLSKGECVDMILGAYNTSSGLLRTDKKFVCNKYPIPCKKGDIFTIELDVERDVYFLGYGASGFIGYVITQGSKVHTYTVPNDNLTHLNFDVYLVDTFDSVEDVGKIVLKKNGKYVNCKKTTPNLVRYLEIGRVGNDDGLDYDDITTVKRSPLVEVVPNRTLYAYNFKNEYRVFYYKKDKSYIGTEILASDFVVPSDCYFVRFQLSVYNITTEDFGVSYLPPSEYRETVAWYYTNEPTRKGDVEFKDTDGLHKVEHKRAKKVFNGTEAWEIYNKSKYTGFSLSMSSMKVGGRDDGLCTHFIPMTTASGSSIDGILFGGTSYNLVITFSSERFSTVEDFKVWLSEELVEIEYPLATPTIEVLDTESQIALNSLETFDGVTYVEDCSRVKPLETECEYGTSQVGAYSLKSLLNSESNAVKIEDAVTTMLLIGA